MDAEEFKAAYIFENVWGNVYRDDIKQVASDSGTEHKTAWTSQVYQRGDEYFEVIWCRDNCGYWGDGERYPAEVIKVKPVEKVITAYEAV